VSDTKIKEITNQRLISEEKEEMVIFFPFIGSRKLEQDVFISK
jgi:hypothetical protein